MTRRRLIALAVVGVQLVLAALAFVFSLLALWPLAALSLAAMPIFLSIVLIWIWRAMEQKQAFAIDRIGSITRTLATQKKLAARGRTQQGAGAANDHDAGFSIGRAAGSELQVKLAADEQAELMFGQATMWQDALLSGSATVPIGVLGDAALYAALSGTRWSVTEEFLPGSIGVQARRAGTQLILCDARAFESGIWAQTIDSSGEWLVQELYQLRAWADRNDALIVLSEHTPLPIGVNTVTIREAFHVVTSSHPHERIDDAPLPRAYAALDALHQQLNGLGSSVSTSEENR